MLRITIKKYKVSTSIHNGRILEQNPVSIDKYEETESLLNVSDIPKARNKFIEKISVQVMKANQDEENRILARRGSNVMKKLVIVNIQ